jgi:AraC family transcriptional regulator of adaptative response/methylated-DNA-[protein]-cysteine methyltransferase
MNQNHFSQIQKALEYIEANFKRQPDLDEVAKVLHMSPLHLQKVFTEWAGVSPKKFLQYISLEYAKDLLKKLYTTSESALETGISGTSRLYDPFVTIEGMTPGEFQDKGRNLIIEYSFSESDFGPVLVGSTDKGVCYMGFADDHTHALADMKSRFPNAQYEERKNEKHAKLLEAMSHRSHERIKLHLRGTPFQLKVWEALLKIPAGYVTTY